MAFWRIGGAGRQMASRSDRRDRHQAIREVVARSPIASQRELVKELEKRGWKVTPATVSRDVAELGLVRVSRDDGHRLLLPEDVGHLPGIGDERLRRLLADIPVTLGRSGLILLLVATPGTASAIAQGIDESSLSEQEGTLAGDNTVLVLFADEGRLERWHARFRELQGLPVPSGRGAG